MKIFIKTLIVSFIFFINLSAMEIKFFCTKHGYWYGRLFSAFISGSNDDEVDFSAATEYVGTVSESLSPQQTLRFLLGQDSFDFCKNWKQLKNDTFKRDTPSLISNIKTIESTLAGHEYLFKKIKQFWGVKKNVKYYIFCSRSQKHFIGLWLQNFEDAKNIHVITLICAPDFEKISVLDYIGVVAHEFSHAMCDAAFGRENFEQLGEKFPSRNSIIAGWLMNEAITVALGNGLFREHISGEKIDLAREEEHCTKGFAKGVYPLVNEYWIIGKSIDSQFLSRAISIFNKIFPNGYKRLDFNLYHTFVIHLDDISPEEILGTIMKNITVSEFQAKPFSKIKHDDLYEIQKKHHTVLIFFSRDEQLNAIKSMLPKHDENQTINVIYRDKQIYIFVKINKKCDIQKQVNQLMKSE